MSAEIVRKATAKEKQQGVGLPTRLCTRRGVARGQVKMTHELTEIKQGTYHYTISLILIRYCIYCPG